jgi:hypothetical protein
MIGPDGVEVPYQVLQSGTIAIQTDLPANSERTWKLYAGKAPAPVNDGVKVAATESYYEITNNLIGVRIPLPTEHLQATPAPIQGLRYRDGRWTAPGPNILSLSAKLMHLRFLERGPLKVVVEVAYTFDRPAYWHKGRDAPAEGLYYPAGEGYYRSTIEVQAGQPSILIEEDTDMDVAYTLDVYDGLHPDQARYRGHHATSKADGYEADGKLYRQAHTRPAMDAFVDLTCEAPKSYRPMAVWDPWVYDSGWYWQLYDAHAAADANLIGIFAGRASRAIGAANSGVSVFTAPQGVSHPTGEERVVGFHIACHRRSPDARYFPRVRFAWGLFIGVKGGDLKDPTQVQPIARQMNLHAGINLNKILRYDVTFPDPTRGYGALYMDGSIVQRMIAQLRQDKAGPHGAGYYGYVYHAEPSIRELVDMWADASGEKTTQVARQIATAARDLLQALVNGDGIYDFRFHYWHGGLEMIRKSVWIDSVLASGLSIPEEKAGVKAAAALFANILWDDDFVPLFAAHGLNLGTENMPVQQQGYRSFYALLLAEHPSMQARAQAVAQHTIDALHHIVHESGAEMGSTHYMRASFGPTLNSLLQLRMLGNKDPFQTEDRLARFAEFYMNLLTPPEVRFGGSRKLISVGDSSSESSEIYGQLATGFSSANPALSARLMGAWAAAGKPHAGVLGSTLLMIDENAPARDPALGDASFPGWYSVLRHGWGTKNETAVWFVNGDFYRDHRHSDQGSVVIYALGAPLSIDWGSMYYPQVPGSFMHSMIVPESGLKHPWDQDNPPLNGGPVWGESTQDAFVSFRTAAYAQAHFTSKHGMVWTRSITSIHPHEAYPVIIMRDHFTAPEAEASKIFSLNLMADGEVDTPAGPMSPPRRTDQHDHQLSSAGSVFPLKPGLKRFGFTGQWAIDWDLYTVSSLAQDARIGNWAHGWHPNREQGEFGKANGRPFEERQHILRIRGYGAFQVLILPYRKGEKREDLRVQQDGSNVVITAGDETTIVGDSSYAYKNADRRILTTFSDAAGEVAGIGAAGGPVEIIVESERATVTAHGTKGMRRLVLPGAWKVQHASSLPMPFVFRGGEWIMDYQSEAPLTVILERP